jgi:hypothetical protein
MTKDSSLNEPAILDYVNEGNDLLLDRMRFLVRARIISILCKLNVLAYEVDDRNGKDRPRDKTLRWLYEYQDDD